MLRIECPFFGRACRLTAAAAYRFISCCSTNAPSLPGSAFCFRKFGKKNTFSTRKMTISLMIITAQSVLPKVMCRNPS